MVTTKTRNHDGTNDGAAATDTTTTTARAYTRGARCACRYSARWLRSRDCGCRNARVVRPVWSWGLWGGIQPSRSTAHVRLLTRTPATPDDDDELIVRASAVLKSQGPENWSRGRPGPHWARKNSLSARDASRENPGNKPLVGWRHVAPQVRVQVLFFSVCKWREGPVTVHRGSVFVWASAPTFAR